jgi:leader peptidase (prepilin peptidase)/N-methyltransferase
VISGAADIVFVALFGLIVGSFLNVCIVRIPNRRSVVRPGSRCPACDTPIQWHDNIPVLSYFALGARCRACGSRISITYPAVEAATALVFVAQYLATGWQPLLVARLVLSSALIVLFVIDLEHRILPNVITLPGILVGLLFSLFLPPGALAAVLGVVLGGGLLLAIGEGYYLLRREEGLGMGDVKMLAMIGAFLGWQLTFVTLVLASIAGSLVGIVMIATRKGDLKYALPFGTFLAFGGLVSCLVGDDLLKWYLGYY